VIFKFCFNVLQANFDSFKCPCIKFSISHTETQGDIREMNSNVCLNFLLAFPPPLVNGRVLTIARNNHCLHNVCPSACVLFCVLMDQVSSYWKAFHDIWYLNIFRKSDFFFQYDRSNGHLTWRRMYICGVRLSSS